MFEVTSTRFHAAMRTDRQNRRSLSLKPTKASSAIRQYHARALGVNRRK